MAHGVPVTTNRATCYLWPPRLNCWFPTGCDLGAVSWGLTGQRAWHWHAVVSRATKRASVITTGLGAPPPDHCLRGRGMAQPQRPTRGRESRSCLRMCSRASGRPAEPTRGDGGAGRGQDEAGDIWFGRCQTSADVSSGEEGCLWPAWGPGRQAGVSGAPGTVMDHTVPPICTHAPETLGDVAAAPWTT